MKRRHDARAALVLLSCALLAAAGGCGPKKGTPVKGAGAPPQEEAATQWKYCPVGYGWGAEFNEKVLAVLADAGCNPKDRAAAAQMAGDAFMFDAVGPLLDVLSAEQDVTLKLAAVSSLGRFRTKKVLLPFAGLLGDKEPKLRMAAAEGLAQLAASRDLVAVDLMKKTAAGKDEDLRAVALLSLGMAGKRAAADGLVAMLASPNAALRQGAVEALGAIADRATLAPLLAALGDEDMDVRVRACYALGQLGDPQSVDPLLGLLDDKEPQVRQAAAYALGIVGDDRAIVPLTDAFKKADQNDRWGLAQSLSMFGPRVFALATELAASEKKGVREFGVEILGRSGDLRAVPLLLKALDDTSEDVRKAAARNLYAGGGKVVDALLARLAKEKSTDVRMDVIRTLGAIGDARAIPALAAAAKDDTDRVRSEAVRALGYFQDEKASATLLAALKDESEWVREAAARSLGYLKLAGATQALLLLLEDEDAYVRASAIAALGDIGDAAAVGPLVGIAKDQNETVRQTVLTALGRLGGPAAVAAIVAGLADDKEFVRQAAVRALSDVLSTKELGDVTPVMVALAGALEDKNFYVRETAAYGISGVQIPYTKEVIDALLGELGEADDLLLNEVFWALSQTGDKEIVGKMLAAYVEGAYGVMTPVEHAVANGGDDNVAARLAELVASGDRYKKASAAIALSFTSAPGAEAAVLPLAASGDAFLEEIAADALASCGGAGAVDALVALLGRQDEDVVVAACDALGEVGRRTGSRAMEEPLVGLLASPDQDVVMAAAGALGTIGSEKGAAAMLKIFRENAAMIKSAGCGYRCGVVASLGAALARIGGEAVRAEMLGMLADPNPRVRGEAAAALARMGPGAGEAVVVQRLKEETDLSVRDGLIRIAGAMRCQKAGPLLKEIAKEADNYTLGAVIGTLGKLGEKKDGKYLAGFLGSPVQSVRVAAVGALGDLKHKPAVPELVKMLAGAGDVWVKTGIVKALARIGDRAAVVDPLAKVVKEADDRLLVVNAALALAGLKYDAIRPTVEERLARFGVPKAVLDCLAYLYGDAAKGNELFAMLRDVKIPRKTYALSDIVLQAFELKGEEGTAYVKALAKEARSPLVAAMAESFLEENE